MNVSRFRLNAWIVAMLLAACVVCVWSYAAEQGDKDEVPMTLEQVPALVKVTLQKESAGGTIKELVKETEDGRLVYGADIAAGGEKFEVLVTPDGKVVKRESGEDEAKEETAEAGEKEEKEERHESAEHHASWMMEFHEAKADLGPTGRNPYYVLEPGYVSTFESKNGKARLVITVLPETRVVDGVTTRVVEEREFSGDRLAEVSANFLAINKRTHNVYYFGEESREYKGGKVVSTEGSWEAGKNGARYGMLVPASPKVGQRYYQEIARTDKAMDRARVASLSEKVEVPAGTFEHVMKTVESSAVERGRESKYYAPGVGLLIDGNLKLTQHGFKK